MNGRAFLRASGLLLIVSLASSGLRAQLDHRQADVTVRVESGTGAPIAGAAVKIEMLNHAFRFGSAVAAGKIEPGNSNFDARTVDNLQKYFNSITYENALKWSEYESRSAARTLELVQNAYDLHAFNSDQPMRQRGHATLWGSQWFVPADARAMTDPAALRTRVMNHIVAYHTTLANQGIDNFDLYNEPFSERALLILKLLPTNFTPAQEVAEVATWFKKARETDPNAKLFINEYNLLNFWQENDSRVVLYKQFIDGVRDAGGPIDGIGVQGHMDRYTTKTQVARRLALLTAPMAPTANHPQGLPGLPVEVTELDINTQQWTNATPQQQAEVTANVLEAAFENPLVQGVTIWVMNDSAHWRDNAIMFDDSNPTNWQIKPSGQAWIDRVKGTWWTNLSGATGANGTYAGTAFKGRHRITVEHEGQKQEVIRDLTDDTQLTVQLGTSTGNNRLTNVSVRAPMDAGQELTLGFVVDGGELPVLIRGAGPALNQFGLSGMPDPRLRIFQGQTQVATNDNWGGNLGTVGGLVFAANSKDAAVLQNLSGPSSAIITGDQPGIVLVEAYDRGNGTSATGPRFVNVSALNRVGTGDAVLIAGFYLEGTGKRRVLVRGVGPELAPFGIPANQLLADPKIDLFRSAATPVLIQSNDDAAPSVSAVVPGAFPLDANTKSAAMVVELDAGAAYSVQVSGVNNGTGTAIVEVYALP